MIDLVGVLRVVPKLLEDLTTITRSTAVLPEMLEAIRGLGDDTAQLQALQRDMRRVAASTRPLADMATATDVLPGMDGRMATIEGAMPVLVEVQQHLARLPETMDALDHGIKSLCEQIDRMLISLDRLDGNVTALAGSVEPLGRIADRLPGGSRR